MTIVEEIVLFSLKSFIHTIISIQKFEHEYQFKIGHQRCNSNISNQENEILKASLIK